MNRSLRAVLTALVVLSAACDDDPLGNGPPERPVVRVEVSAPLEEVWLGRVVTFSATAYDAVGAVNRRLTWSSSDTTVAQVDSAGVVTTRGIGTVRIRASADGVNGERTLTVYTWDLMFFSLGGGTFAETLVLPPNSGGFPERIFPVGRNAADAVPSPDGMRIAYAVRDAEGYTDLWIANRDGSAARLLARTEGNDEWPTWSPDGTRIAFESDVTGLGDIWVVNTDGSGLQRLTMDPLPAVVQDADPAWSPDGSRIAFSSTREGYYAIWTMRPDGTDLRRISPQDGYSDLEPAWSPTGARIALLRVGADNEWDIWVMNNDGSGAVRHAQPGRQRAPSWRADGNLLTYSSQSRSGEPWQVWTMSFAGTDVVQQTPDSFTGGHRPVWLRRR